MHGLLVTGTDTDVGKTYTTVHILEAARSAGIRAAAMKPVETGCRQRGAQLVPSDASLLAKAAGMNDIDTVNPCRFKTPVAQYTAGIIEGRSVPLTVLKRTCRDLLANNDLVVVEGAGGLLVPITKQYSYADLAHELSLPVLVIAANKLGVINHILLTVDYMNGHGLTLCGVVLNNLSPKNDPAKKTNAATLASLLGKRFIGELTYNRPERDTPVYRKILTRCVSRGNTL